MVRICVLTLFATMLFGECNKPPDPREGVVEVIASDISGQQPQITELKFFRQGSRVAEITTRASKTRLPYGEYRVRVYATGFYSEWRDIVVNQAQVVVRVPLKLGTIECADPPTAVSGTLVQGRLDGELWVKVVPLQGTGGGESRVGKAGHFLVAGLPAGQYVVLVLNGESVLHTRVVTTHPASSSAKLFIDLGIK